ncbi:MAG TPA: hypothetical protein VK830_04735 [Xanthomonadales bacterium]|nr:hypothetical protein [Xanthomonadales bacterium]
MNATEQRLQASLARNHELAELTRARGFPAREFAAVQQWQRQRLAETYADLLAEEQFEAAGHFFLEEIYGGLEFRERDQQVARVLPVMARMLPEHMLRTMTGAFDLQALSLELDMDMARHMAAAGLLALDTPAYGRIYRSTGRERDRDQQIELFRRLGLELVELVRHRLVLNFVRLMRMPARAAGFGRLQDFLEQGLWAFRQMQDGEYFVLTVHQREQAIMINLRAGSDQPFEVAK